MTQERKDELYDEMFGWICEHIHDSHDLYITLHEHFGMSMEELHDHCIESLDEFFTEEDPISAFRQKISSCYDAFVEGWLRLSPAELIEKAEEIASIQRMRDELPSSVTEEDAAYLLRFKNPLEVVSDSWQEMNGSGSVVDDEMRHILWELRDKQSAEQEYELEPGFEDAPDPDMQQTVPQMSM